MDCSTSLIRHWMCCADSVIFLLSSMTMLVLCLFVSGCIDDEWKHTGPLKYRTEVHDGLMTIKIAASDSLVDGSTLLISIPQFESSSQSHFVFADWKIDKNLNGAFYASAHRAGQTAQVYDIFFNYREITLNGLFVDGGLATLQALTEVTSTSLTSEFARNPVDILLGGCRFMDGLLAKVATGAKWIPVEPGDEVSFRFLTLSQPKGVHTCYMDCCVLDYAQILSTDVTMNTSIPGVSKTLRFEQWQERGIGRFTLPGVLSEAQRTYFILSRLEKSVKEVFPEYQTMSPSAEELTKQVAQAHERVPVEVDLGEQTQGMLDCVFCIDKSGSMADDAATVRQQSTQVLTELQEYASEQNISLRTGVVGYTRHDEEEWLQARPLTPNIDEVQRNISEVTKIVNTSIGRGGNEDLYGAMLYAMNEEVTGIKINMGWREGAAKIVIPMGDEPANEDLPGCTLDRVAQVARDLDPVHMYPLLLPKQGSFFLDPAVRSMERIAKATKGQVVRVQDPNDLPAAIVATVKLAVRQHRNEVWRKEHPPYFLYGTLFGIVGLIFVALAGLSVHTLISRRRQ